MTVIRRNGLTWTADRTGLGHANPHDRTLRALCGARPTADRYAWPVRVWCAVCRAIEDGRKHKGAV